MKLILIPTDFSPIATNAMHYGLQMARQIKGGVMLLHVYNVPVSVTDVPVLLVSAEEVKKDAEIRIKELHDHALHITSGEVKIYTETRLGTVVDELEEVCKQFKPFAVVMGTKGSTGLERVLFGSTTLSAIRHLTSPVIVVPPGKQFGSGIHKIGLACDFRNIAETTPAEMIKNMVKEFGASLDVLNVDYHERHFKPSTPEESAHLHTMLEEAKPVYHFIEHQDVEDGINEFAEKNNLDLLISIPKKHKLLEGIFKPSSTRQLVFQSHIPVMCVHE